MKKVDSISNEKTLIKPAEVLLITPPFTQLNTPYPGTIYLKGFLNTIGITSYQADLGMEVILDLFSHKGLELVFQHLEKSEMEVSDNCFRMFNMRKEYLKTIDAVIEFLQNKNPTLAHSICNSNFLPQAARFHQLDDLSWAFGSMGLQDKARHLATLYLEDLGDLIKEAIDPHFGFSRYAERLGRTASSFDELLSSLDQPETIISSMLLKRLEGKIKAVNPKLLCLSVPFPGNLFAALKCGAYVKKHYPAIKVALGGGFANTELRSVADPRVFDFLDFICLDDGEVPLQFLLEHLNGNRELELLKRTFAVKDNKVIYFNGAAESDIAQKDTGTPDYSDLLLSEYLSVIEVANPMHRMWSDGRWNKLTLAHGCYWGKCSFCDVSLDYIRKYEPLTAALICDRMEEIMAQTGQSGFHFVDEAAPPNLLREVALEILKRGIVVSWWTNIRFEKHFTADLCRLLAASGCIAVAGGLEVASDRLLELMKKGVTVAQVARVADSFTASGIMVHAYLMYGFPTQTAQETIDSLEMVRQLFEQEVLQSGFWHLFAMTSHSPVGKAPEKFAVHAIGPEFKGFADNDLFHEDPSGADHEAFSEGLRISLFNYMHGAGFEMPVNKWFPFSTPKTSIPSNYIEACLMQVEKMPKLSSRMIWLEALPQFSEELMDGQNMMRIDGFDKKEDWSLLCEVKIGGWLQAIFPSFHDEAKSVFTFNDFQKSFNASIGKDFEAFYYGDLMQLLRGYGLFIV